MTDWNKALGLDNIDTPAESRYHTSESGTYWISYDDGKEQRDHLADAIRLIGRAVDDEGRNWRIIEWRDRYHATHRAALDMGDIGTPAGWRTLQSHGITIKAGRKKRERLADYLQGSGKNTRWQLARKAGWHGGAYILPSGEILGEAVNIHYHGDTSQGKDYQPRGSLEDWQQLAQLAQGNSRLCLALGCALARPARPRKRRLSPLRRQLGRQNHRRAVCLVGMGQPQRAETDLGRHRTRLQQHRRRP